MFKKRSLLNFAIHSYLMLLVNDEPAFHWLVASNNADRQTGKHTSLQQQ
jgi:hypothetical protein